MNYEWCGGGLYAVGQPVKGEQQSAQSSTRLTQSQSSRRGRRTADSRKTAPSTATATATATAGPNTQSNKYTLLLLSVLTTESKADVRRSIKLANFWGVI